VAGRDRNHWNPGGLLLPAIQAAREAARARSCLNNMKQLGLALQAIIHTYKSLPIGAQYPVDRKNWRRRLVEREVGCRSNSEIMEAFPKKALILSISS